MTLVGDSVTLANSPSGGKQVAVMINPPSKVSC